MKLFATVSVVSVLAASTIGVRAADLRGAARKSKGGVASAVNMETGRHLLQSSFTTTKLRNGLDNSLCLTWTYTTEELQVQKCQDGNGYYGTYVQAWDLFVNLGEPRLFPGADMCLKALGADGSSAYEKDFTMVSNEDKATCIAIETTADGKIYTEYADGTRMYLGISGSCWASVAANLEGKDVELQRFDFGTDRTCGQAQLWYVE